MVVATIRPTKTCDPKTFTRMTAFITTSVGNAIMARNPGSANTEYDVVKAKISYCPVYKRKIV